jgi:KDO2-lipid IV(A) lauroyltransferase
MAEPLPSAGGDAETLQRAQASVINRAMQQLILQCPQQYLWGYNRYKVPRRVEAVPAAADGP